MSERDDETKLVEIAKAAISTCYWVVGECAALWTQRHAKGRTDADFGTMIGLDGDKVQKRRTVWSTFADVKDNYRRLTWSHFYAGLTWEDSAECFAWAEENQATVAEMKAWRRLQHGEDLELPPSIEQWESDWDDVYAPERKLEDEDELESQYPAGIVTPAPIAASQQPAATMATLAETEDESAYAPFRPTTGAPPREDNGDGASRDAVLIRKTCNAVTSAIKKADDSQQFVTELLSACWREDQGGTAAAVKLFAQANPLCK